MTTTWAAFCVGRGLDSGRRHHEERPAERARCEELTSTTTSTED